MPPTKLPGLKMRAGSKRSLTRRMTAKAPGSGSPHDGRAARTASGASWSVHERPADRLGAAGEVVARHGDPRQAEGGAADHPGVSVAGGAQNGREVGRAPG